MTLINMSVPQVEQHYTKLIGKRYHKVRMLLDEADLLPKRSKARKIVLSEAERLLDKAQAYAKPMQNWQADRARILMDQYGLRVAAGFLKAHGFPLEVTVRVLGLLQR